MMTEPDELRAEIDEGAWSTLYSTISRPFAPPDTSKIAVKVINPKRRFPAP